LTEEVHTLAKKE